MICSALSPRVRNTSRGATSKPRPTRNWERPRFFPSPRSWPPRKAQRFEPGPASSGPSHLQSQSGGTTEPFRIAPSARSNVPCASHRPRVQEAYTQLLEAQRALDYSRNHILPSIEEDIRISEKAYADGEVAYLFVLETSRRLYEARLLEAAASAALQRATAQLERAVGRKISETH